jgi:putative membrane protein
MRRRIVFTSASFFCLAAPIAFAQGGNPAGVAPLTPERAPGVPQLHVPNDSDRLFVQQAAIGGLSEVENGRIASQQASDADVRAFAERIVADHGKANRDLAGAAEADRLRVPDALDADHRVALDDLRKRRGVDFDRVYLGQQIAAHQTALHLLEWQLGAGQDDALREFAKQNIPVVLEHLSIAIDLQQRLAMSAPIGNGNAKERTARDESGAPAQ